MHTFISIVLCRGLRKEWLIYLPYCFVVPSCLDIIEGGVGACGEEVRHVQPLVIGRGCKGGR